MLTFLTILLFVNVFPVGFFTYKTVLAETSQISNSLITFNFQLCVKSMNDYKCYFWSAYWIVFCLFLIIFELLQIGPKSGSVEISFKRNVLTDNTATSLLYQCTPWTFFYCFLFAIPCYFSYRDKCFQLEPHLDLSYALFRWLFVGISVALPLLSFLVMPFLCMICKHRFGLSILIRWRDDEIDNDRKQILTDSYKKAFNLWFSIIYSIVFYFIYQYLL